jgi:hypothetical protein
MSIDFINRPWKTELWVEPDGWGRKNLVLDLLRTEFPETIAHINVESSTAPTQPPVVLDGVTYVSSVHTDKHFKFTVPLDGLKKLDALLAELAKIEPNFVCVLEQPDAQYDVEPGEEVFRYRFDAVDGEVFLTVDTATWVPVFNSEYPSKRFSSLAEVL